MLPLFGVTDPMLTDFDVDNP